MYIPWANQGLYIFTETFSKYTYLHIYWLYIYTVIHTSSITRIALRWTPQGKRNRGRPKETWRRTIEKKLKSQNLTLQTAPQAAADEDDWRSLVRTSSTNRRREDWLIDKNKIAIEGENDSRPKQLLPLVTKHRTQITSLALNACLR